jgi:hypothetical protein
VRPAPLWGGPDDVEGPYPSRWPDDPDDRGNEPLFDDGDEDEPTFPPPSVEPPPNRWAHALVAGLQAAAWWFRRHTGRSAFLTALGVGLAAALAAYVSGPVLLTAAGLAGALLALTTLADAVRTGAAVLSGDSLP